MLAKIWKKVLLAICVIACIYNVTAKIVNRHSLEENLKSANDGETVFDLSKNETESNQITSSSENTIEKSSIATNTVSETENNESNNENKTFLEKLFDFKFLF